MKWILSFLLTFSGVQTAFAQDLPGEMSAEENMDRISDQIDVERAVVNADSFVVEAKEAKANLKSERARKIKLKKQTNAALLKAKNQEDRAQIEKSLAQSEIARLKVANTKLQQQIEIARARQVAAQNRIAEYKQKRDEFLDQKKISEQNLGYALDQTRDLQMQEKDALEANRMARQELAVAKAREHQALARLQRTKLVSKKSIAQAKAHKLKMAVQQSRQKDLRRTKVESSTAL